MSIYPQAAERFRKKVLNVQLNGATHSHCARASYSALVSLKGSEFPGDTGGALSAPRTGSEWRITSDNTPRIVAGSCFINLIRLPGTRESQMPLFNRPVGGPRGRDPDVVGEFCARSCPFSVLLVIGALGDKEVIAVVRPSADARVAHQYIDDRLGWRSERGNLSAHPSLLIPANHRRQGRALGYRDHADRAVLLEPRWLDGRAGLGNGRKRLCQENGS